MEATVVDLRYRMNDVLKALARNEPVRVLGHGKVKGVIRSATEASTPKVRGHAFFGSRASAESVDRAMERYRRGRRTDGSTNRRSRFCKTSASPHSR